MYAKALFLILLGLISVYFGACKKKSVSPQVQNGTWDLDKNGIPHFVNTNYIDLTKISNISKYRSSFGHNYSDFTEHCRSMKHYFEPKPNTDWSTIPIFSPIKGVIKRLDMECAGTKIEIASDDMPAFRFSIFHVILQGNRTIGEHLPEGELLGTHIGNQTMSDIAVIVNDPSHQGRMVSYFETITEALFQAYVSRGAKTRDDFLISKAWRDAHPLTCDGETFTSTDTIQNWVKLQ